MLIPTDRSRHRETDRDTDRDRAIEGEMKRGIEEEGRGGEADR
jgi:hypothetical protein